MGAGFSNNLEIFRNGSNGPYRMLMSEAWGYSVLDLTNPVNPTAIFYHDDRFPLVSQGGTNSIDQAGDGQANVLTIAVAPDGHRMALGMQGPTSFQTVVGSPTGNGFVLWGDFPSYRPAGTLIQHVASRYIAYDIATTAPTAADVTTLPTDRLQVNNLAGAFETTNWPLGAQAAQATLAGNYILYLGAGGLQVIDASDPGPIGNITGSYPRTAITSADFGGRAIAAFAAAVDPADATKLWVLAELSAQAGENSPSYGLLYVTVGLTKVSAGQIWRVPSQAGEYWHPTPGPSSALVAGKGSLFVLMWAQRQIGGTLYRLYSTMTTAWGSIGTSTPPGQFNIPTNLYNNFTPGQPMRGLAGSGTSLYAYIPTGSSAYVIPMSCFDQNAAADASMSVTNQEGAPLANGDTVFLGDQVTIVPSINPAPISQQLTGFGWNFDFDFHAGAASDDNGVGTSPRIKAPDNQTLGSPSAPPATITVVGPCDPQVGGTTPSSGSGCWTSVTTNGSSGGPDFVSAPAAGAIQPLSFAFEANNGFGSAGASLFTLNWKVPAARIQDTVILAGQPLVSASDGHPSAAGFRWYFGASPTTLTQASCTGPACVPTLDTKGTYFWWLTVSYANGYVTPDYAGTTAMGTYTVTGFVPAFAVNGATNGPITVIASQNLTVSNSSRRDATVTAAGYFYSLCILGGGSSCNDSYVPWNAMGDAPPGGAPPAIATIPIPAVAGTYALKIKVNHTGGTAFWPDPAGVTYIGLNVVSVIPLNVTVTPSPSTATAGSTVTFTCNVTGGLPPYSYQWRSPASFVVPGAIQATYQTTLPNPGTILAVCAVTDSQPIPVTASDSATAIFVPHISVTVSASPTAAAVNQTATFSCDVTGGIPPYAYVWRLPPSSPFVAGTSQTFQVTSPTPTSIQAGCTATDSVGGSAANSGTVQVVTAWGPLSVFVLTPCRLLDTRNPAGPLGGPSIQPQGTIDRVVTVASSCGIPIDAKAISVNLTVTNSTAAGIVSIYRGDGQPTGTNGVVFKAGRTQANNAMLQLALDASGTIKVQNISSGTFDLVIDVNGFFR